MNKVPSFEVKLFVGLRAGYTDLVYPVAVVTKECQKYCDEKSLCVTITETNFVYKNGNEPGVFIGLINYPRFPSSKENILEHAKNIGYILMDKLEQNRVTIITPGETIMLESTDGSREA